MLQLITRKGSEGEGPEGDKKQSGDRGGDKTSTSGWKREGEVSLSGSMTRQVGCWYFVYLISWVLDRYTFVLAWEDTHFYLS